MDDSINELRIYSCSFFLSTYELLYFPILIDFYLLLNGGDEIDEDFVVPRPRNIIAFSHLVTLDSSIAPVLDSFTPPCLLVQGKLANLFRPTRRTMCPLVCQPALRENYPAVNLFCLGSFLPTTIVIADGKTFAKREKRKLRVGEFFLLPRKLSKKDYQ